MLPAVLVLVAGYLVLQTAVPLRVFVLLLVVAAPLGWALHQHHASGRYSIGTSLDGINFHKGNNEGFLRNYPPRQSDSLDWYDFNLNQGLHFTGEWTYNDFHRRAAFTYLTTYPRQTLAGDLRKLNVLFFSCRKYGSTASHGAARLFEEAGLLLFRLIFWTAILSSIYLLFRLGPRQKSRISSGAPAAFTGPERVFVPLHLNFSRLRVPRLLAGIFVATVVACTVPYVAGFAYTRHVSILIYPSALFCCRLLCPMIPAQIETCA